MVQVQITTQSKTFVDRGSFTAPDNPVLPYAVYEGFGKFAVVVPENTDFGIATDGFVDGAMLIDRANEVNLDDLEVGEVFSVDITDTAVIGGTSRTYNLSIDATEGAEAMDFTVFSSRNGSIKDVLAFYDVTLANPRLLGGIFIGVLLAFLFCALTMNAVGRAAYAMMGECRRQFAKMREGLRKQGMSEEDVANPDNWPKQGLDVDGHHYPDYANCVSISTAGAQKEMVVPALLAIIVPIAVGLVLSVPGVMGLLAGGLTSGFAVAVFMANSGGAWDNAKKLLESYGKITATDMVNGTGDSSKVPASVRDAIMARAQEAVTAGNGDLIVYGKGSEDHKATVVGDTVGDPFKDTSGPALNILIKLISIVSVVFAGLVVAYGSIIGAAIGLH